MPSCIHEPGGKLWAPVLSEAKRAELRQALRDLDQRTREQRLTQPVATTQQPEITPNPTPNNVQPATTTSSHTESFPFNLKDLSMKSSFNIFIYIKVRFHSCFDNRLTSRLTICLILTGV